MTLKGWRLPAAEFCFEECRHFQHNIFTLRGPDRLVIDLKDSRLAKSLTSMPAGTGAVRSIRSAIRADGQLRVVLDLNTAVRSRTFTAGPNARFFFRLSA